MNDVFTDAFKFVSEGAITSRLSSVFNYMFAIVWIPSGLPGFHLFYTSDKSKSQSLLSAVL